MANGTGNGQALATDKSGQIQKQPEQKRTLAGLVTQLKDEIARALPRHLTPDRMARVVMTALRTVPGLAECTQESFAGCLMQLAQLGLEPNTPLQHAWLIPRRDNRNNRTECTMIIGYQGYLELFRRAGSNAQSHIVRDGDTFSYSLGLHPTLNHIPSPAADRETKPITYVYAVARTKEFPESPIFNVLSTPQVEARERRSSTFGKSFSPWKSDRPAMFEKTGIRAIAKWVPKQAELALAVAIDEAGEDGRSQMRELDPGVAEVLAARGLLEADSSVDIVDAPTSDEPAEDDDAPPRTLDDGSLDRDPPRGEQQELVPATSKAKAR